jgi:hypothetical protein
MLFSRRTFLQSTLSAGLAAAAEATGSRWLLKPVGRIRIGIAGLGATALDHLALFAAIPGAEIAGLADPSMENLHTAAGYLRDNGQRPPSLYRNSADLLNDRSLHALAIPSCCRNGAQMMRDAIATRISILLDAPPVLSQRELERMLRLLQTARIQVHFRLADYLYPSTVTDVRSWLTRSGSSGADLALVLQPFAAREDLRIPVIAALDAVLDASGATDEELRVWGTQGQQSARIEGTGSSCVIALPPNRFKFEDLLVHSFAGMLESVSTLHLRSARGSVKLGIASEADVVSSLQTAMLFLASVRDVPPADPKRWCRAQVAATGADRVLVSLKASGSRLHTEHNDTVTQPAS